MQTFTSHSLVEGAGNCRCSGLWDINLLILTAKSKICEAETCIFSYKFKKYEDSTAIEKQVIYFCLISVFRNLVLVVHFL